MIIAIINIIFMWNFINSWKLLSENPQHHPEKIRYPFFTHSLPKNSKSASPLSVPTLKNFQNSQITAHDPKNIFTHAKV